MSLDRIAIYQKLVGIKPFFQDVEKIKTRKLNAKKAYTTGRTATLVATGGVWIETTTVHGGGQAHNTTPLFVLYE